MSDSTRSTFTIEQAANFLHVSEDRINELIQQRRLRLWSDRRRKYLLGGDLDMCKAMMRPPMKLPAVLSETVSDGETE